MTFRRHNRNSLERRKKPSLSNMEKKLPCAWDTRILYPVNLQPDNNLFCSLCVIPHSLQAIIMIYPEKHFFTIKYLIHLISVLTINNCCLFCDAPPTCFIPYRPSSGRSFTRNIYIYIYIYTHTHTYIHIYIHTYIHTYIHMCVCVCVYNKWCQRCAYIKYVY